MTSIIRVTKEFSFDMAHALFGYDGPCKNIHGHTYRLLVTIRGKVLNEVNHPKDGMLLDFGWLKKIVNDRIISQYDHALLLNENIPVKQKEDLVLVTEKIQFVPYQPTCENLLLAIKKELTEAFKADDFELFKVKLYETPTSYAEWYQTDERE